MTLRIGILGAARVATYAMIGAAKEVEGVTVAAVAARDPERAKAYAQTHDIAHVFPDYAALIASPEIDAVYNALPPNLHAKWSIAALEAGKPVLCEKPFALCVEDVEAMLAAEARTGKLLMEAQHSHYHPIGARMREVVQSGLIGSVRHISACFNAEVKRTPTEIRWDPEVGGGALWDLGVYPVYWLRSIIGQQPRALSAQQTLADSGADIRTSASLIFASGARGTIETDMAGALSVWVNVEGSAGTMRVENPLSAAFPQSVILNINGSQTVETFSRRPSYAFQLEAFRDAVLHDAPVPTCGEDSLATIRLLAAIRDTARKEA
jgi:predicted dehydrogenase